MTLEKPSLIRMTTSWSGAPGMSGMSSYELRLISDHVEMWVALDDDDPLECLSQCDEPGWRAALSLVCAHWEIPLASPPTIEGVTGRVLELFRLGWGTDEDKRLADGLSALSDEQLEALAEKMGSFAEGPGRRALAEVQKELFECDLSWLAIIDPVMAAAPDLSDAAAWADEAWERRAAEARAAQQAREEALRPYREQIDRLRSALPKLPEIPRYARGVSSAYLQQKDERACTVRAIEDSFLASGGPPSGVQTFDLPRNLKPFRVDFDDIQRRAGRPPAAD